MKYNFSLRKKTFRHLLTSYLLKYSTVNVSQVIQKYNLILEINEKGKLKRSEMEKWR